MPSFSALYIEEEIQHTERAQEIAALCSDIPHIVCRHYGEVFNPKSQNFRLQKQNPGLILAKKHNKYIIPTPPGFGFGKQNSYYFSHMLNCPYDCRYCFLQGMYRSAHHVLFINYDDFEEKIEEVIAEAKGEPCFFYSGYDCDSLALEPFSQFAAHFIPVFKRHPQVSFELRTKSTQIRSLQQHEPSQNCIIALSFSPENIADALEKRVPSMDKRIEAARKLQQQGWPVALRFEPLIDHCDYKENYRALFKQVFNTLDADRLHSVSMGLFRMPQTFFRNIVKLYPDEPLYAGEFEQRDGITAYPMDVETEMITTLEKQLLDYIPASIYYQCRNE